MRRPSLEDAGCESLDSYTFSVSLGERNWPFFDFMGEQTFWAIVSHAAIKKYGNPEIAKNPAAAAGTGPYRIVETRGKTTASRCTAFPISRVRA